MKTAQFFYPGFEYAGFESKFDCALTILLCDVVVTWHAVREPFQRLTARLAPRLAPQFDA